MRKLICTIVFTAAVFGAAPAGWILAGSDPKSYDTGIDVINSYAGQPSAYLKSTAEHPNGFGSLMQSIDAANYRAKRVRFAGYVKVDQVTGAAGLWMRVDKGRDYVAFDNMNNRPIKGTLGWTQYSVVLDVAPDATGIAFGVLLPGTGSLWLSGVTFQVVDASVPTTDHSSIPAEPVNLDFRAPAH